jgi:FkbM family methyltransferase
MIRNLAKTINTNVLNKLGFHLKKIGRNHDTVIALLNKLNESANGKIVFDVGAHVGTSIERFRALYGKDAVIYAFEPSKLYASLSERYADKSTKVIDLGLSNKTGVQTFYELSESTGSSSFEKIDDLSAFARRREIATSHQLSKMCVRTSTIDQFCIENEISQISHLKIDVQGHEPQVLEGATQLLSTQSIDIVELEVIVGRAYKCQSSFMNVEKYLIPAGYRLISLSPDGRGYNMEPHDVILNPELQFDLIYCSNKFYSGN